MMSRLGDRLRSAREQRQQSLERIAVRLGLPPSELTAYEAGEVVPDRMMLLRLERVLGLPIGWLTSVMREPDQEPPQPR
jgi:transcriptional regulator with XRE-family HTH domain